MWLRLRQGPSEDEVKDTENVTRSCSLPICGSFGRLYISVAKFASTCLQRHICRHIHMSTLHFSGSAARAQTGFTLEPPLGFEMPRFKYGLLAVLLLAPVVHADDNTYVNTPYIGLRYRDS